MARNYKVRYFVDAAWDKPMAEEDKMIQVAPGIQVSSTDFGYTDKLFLASIIINSEGKPNVLLLDTEDGPHPSRETLLLIKEMCEHYLEKHS